MTHIHLKLNERAVLVRDGKPERALGPGRYTFWKRYEVARFNTDELAFTAPVAIVNALPIEWYETVRLAAGQYGVVLRDERAVAFLRPGVHRIWKVDANVVLRVYDEKDALPELTPELRAAIPANELLEVNLEPNQRGALLRDGKPERVLEPGHHAFWGMHQKAAIWNLDDLVFLAQPDVVAMLPLDLYATIQLAAIQRAVIVR
ncbi:MAG: hypothetical protein WKG01_35575, partial [Kofleriaceae bacterium]